jgi:predicted transcriptional regulator
MVNYTPAVVGKMNEVNEVADVTIREHMSGAFISLTGDMTILEATKSLLKLNLTGAPVVDEKGFLIGFLSERDCIKFNLDCKYYNHAPSNVSHYMSKKLLSLSPEDSLMHVVELFLKNNFQMYPVVEDHKVIGIVSRRMILSAVLNLQETSW